MSTLRAFTMPKWGIEMTEGTLAEWNIKEGERVAKGQVIAQIETDKIVNEVQAESDVTFVRLLATPGDVYPVGALLGVTATDPTPPAAPTPTSVPRVSRKPIRNSVSRMGRKLSRRAPATSSRKAIGLKS